ncbi:MAG: class II fructose-bisphosphate aldolase [Phycisphaerae bacterium]|nr:class II fructose-bisphosphate aldolase [Phycisphaerae bacterium]
MISTAVIMKNAPQEGIVVPAFNIPYLPMMEPVVRALADTNTFGLVTVARLEWRKFHSKGMKEIRDEYQRVKNDDVTRLHLDHIPVIDEDNQRVDYRDVITEALDLGYESVMIDGSRLSLEDNIRATREITDLAKTYSVPVEAELGAVMGHEEGPLPPYEELFASGKGFTSPEEARRFVAETNVDWLSVAIGNIHGAISKAGKNEKKLQARLNIEHLRTIYEAVNIPLVLHGGTGIQKEYIMRSIQNGIAKINIATAIRQPYEKGLDESVSKAQDAVYEETTRIVKDELEIAGTAERIIRQVKP